jgi:hypothetical protein
VPHPISVSKSGNDKHPAPAATNWPNVLFLNSKDPPTVPKNNVSDLIIDQEMAVACHVKAISTIMAMEGPIADRSDASSPQRACKHAK